MNQSCCPYLTAFALRPAGICAYAHLQGLCLRISHVLCLNISTFASLANAFDNRLKSCVHSHTSCAYLSVSYVRVSRLLCVHTVLRICFSCLNYWFLCFSCVEQLYKQSMSVCSVCSVCLCVCVSVCLSVHPSHFLGQYLFWSSGARQMAKVGGFLSLFGSPITQTTSCVTYTMLYCYIVQLTRFSSGDWRDIFIAHVIIIIKSEVSTFPIVIIFFRGRVSEMFVTSYSVTYCIYIPEK